jgi:hypothetical protein
MSPDASLGQAALRFIPGAERAKLIGHPCEWGRIPLLRRVSNLPLLPPTREKYFLDNLRPCRDRRA